MSTDEETPGAEYVPGAELDYDLSTRLKDLGFDPGTPVYLHHNENDQLSVDDVRRALFESTYHEPVPIQFYFGGEWPMLLESARAVWLPWANSVSPPLECKPWPDWYLRGVLYKDVRLPDPNVVVFHVYLAVVVPEALEPEPGYPTSIKAYTQLVPEPSGADPESPLRWGEHVPGQRVQ